MTEGGVFIERKEKRFRHELKYYISYYDYRQLKERINKILELDVHAEGKKSYHVRSLYFDDIYSTAYTDKVEGISERIKYRIRIYDKSTKLIRLEKKEKIGDMVSKRSRVITIEQYNLILNQELSFMLEEPLDLFRDFYIESKINLLKPTVIVDYEREPYVIGDIRITFDMNLMAGINGMDIFDEDNIYINCLDKEIMILEIKYNEYLPDYIWMMLQDIRHNHCAISKYAICREYLNNYKWEEVIL